MTWSNNTWYAGIGGGGLFFAICITLLCIFYRCWRRHRLLHREFNYELLPRKGSDFVNEVNKNKESLMSIKSVRFDDEKEDDKPHEAGRPDVRSSALPNNLDTPPKSQGRANSLSNNEKTPELQVTVDKQPSSELDVHKLGKIQFHIQYDFKEMNLELRIIRAVNLPAKDITGTSDPYAKIMLLPNRKQKLQTNIKHRSLNPRWNELFAFEGFPYSKLQNRTLYIQVLDYDRFSRDDPIGELVIPLADLDLVVGQTLWKALHPCEGAGKLGELQVSLCYEPKEGKLSIMIIKACQLKAKDINGLSDPYTKVWLLLNGERVEKKKTVIKHNDLNPVYNESFIFDVPFSRIRQTSFFISVMDHDRFGRNECIGSVILGSKAGDPEMRHWNEMFSKSRKPVAKWHSLKSM